MDTSTPELGVTKAAEEPISDLARIRLELTAVDEAMESDEPKSGWQYSNTLFQLNLGLSRKLHMLIDTIDSQQRELDALRAQVAAGNKALVSVWWSLTDNERKALQSFGTGSTPTDELNSLLRRRLLGWKINYSTHNVILTELGRMVLEAVRNHD